MSQIWLVACCMSHELRMAFTVFSVSFTKRWKDSHSSGHSFLGTQPCSFIYVLSISSYFCAEEVCCWIVATKTGQQNLNTLRPFTESFPSLDCTEAHHMLHFDAFPPFYLSFLASWGLNFSLLCLWPPWDLSELCYHPHVFIIKGRSAWCASLACMWCLKLFFAIAILFVVL